jgi:hypothetical protein
MFILFIIDLFMVFQKSMYSSLFHVPVTSGHVTTVGVVTSGHCVISSVGHVHGNTVVSVVPAGETVF